VTNVTDKDREAARTAMRAADHAHGSSAKTECYAQAIATARAEERECCMQVAVRAVEAAIRARGED